MRSTLSFIVLLFIGCAKTLPSGEAHQWRSEPLTNCAYDSSLVDLIPGFAACWAKGNRSQKWIDREVAELNEIHEQKMRILDELYRAAEQLLGSYGPVCREYTEPGRDIINGSNHKVPHLAMPSVLCFPFTLFHITSPSHQRIWRIYEWYDVIGNWCTPQRPVLHRLKTRDGAN